MNQEFYPYSTAVLFSLLSAESRTVHLSALQCIAAIVQDKDTQTCHKAIMLNKLCVEDRIYVMDDNTLSEIAMAHEGCIHAECAQAYEAFWRPPTLKELILPIDTNENVKINFHEPYSTS